MAPHSSTLAWKIPWMEEPGGLPSMGSHRVGHNWSDLAAAAWHNMADHISSLSSQTCLGKVLHFNKAAVSPPVQNLYLWASKEERRQPRRSPCSFRWTPCDVVFHSGSLPITGQLSDTPLRPVDFESLLRWVRRRQWHPTPVLLSKSHGWRSLVGCSPWGR